MDIKQLRSFIAVANALSFSRAARQIHLSQPALSTQIQGLESQLGVQLLVRNRRTVRLTPSGESLLAEGHLLLQQISNIERRVASIGSGEVGHLRLGFVASATMPLIPAIALAFKKRYPGVSLELRNLPTTNQIEALRNGTIDAGFVRLPLAVNGLSIEGIHREPFAIVLAKSHRLARERNLTVQHLSGEPFVSYGRHGLRRSTTTGRRSVEEQASRRGSFRKRQRWRQLWCWSRPGSAWPFFRKASHGGEARF